MRERLFGLFLDSGPKASHRLLRKFGEFFGLCTKSVPSRARRMSCGAFRTK